MLPRILKTRSRGKDEGRRGLLTWPVTRVSMGLDLTGHINLQAGVQRNFFILEPDILPSTFSKQSTIV